MQKRTNSFYAQEYAHWTLDPLFPITGGEEIIEITDRPITFLHRHNVLELGYCHAGYGVFVVEQKVLPFGPGDVSVISEQELHIARSAEHSSSHWTFLMLDPCCLVPEHPEDRLLLSSTSLAGADFANILSPLLHPQLARLLQDIIAELRQHAPGYRTAVRGYILTIMAHLHRISASNTTPAVVSSPLQHAHLAPALNYLTKHYHEPVRLDQLAALCAMSEGHFRHCFRRATGLTPHHYLTRLRLTMASSLLKHTDTPILTIAMQVGYSAVSSFNRQFLTLFGVPPSTWRAGAR